MGSTFAAREYIERLTGPQRIRAGSSPNTATGTADPTDVVRPYLLQMNKTATTNDCQTNQETLAPAFSATPGGAIIMIGGDNIISDLPAGVDFLGVAQFHNAAAELSAPQRAQLLTGLGW
jgi:hypothetical protein